MDGHREKTWTTDDGLLWLRDLLPADTSNARVLTYGYDADTRSGECVSTQTLRRHADGFAKALSRIRKDAPRVSAEAVPVPSDTLLASDYLRCAWLGRYHSQMGSLPAAQKTLLIFAQALVICHNQSLESKCDLRDVLVSTHGILFFGTPHSGLEATTLLTAINRLASVYMKSTEVIIKDLQAHSSELENVQSLYVAASEKISSVFFCEEYAMSGIGNQREGVRIVLYTDQLLTQP